MRSVDGYGTIARLDLPETCTPGGLHHISFSYDYAAKHPFDRALLAFFAWPLRFYTGRIIFTGDIPSHIEYVKTAIEHDGDITNRRITTQNVPINMREKTAQLTLENIEPSTGVFQW